MDAGFGMRARLPRSLHPAAWWLWALGLAAAASRTTNPVLLALIIAVVCCVVLARRTDAPWALSFRLYVVLAGFIVVMRVAYRVIFGGGAGPTILLTLPEIRLPEIAAGIRLFGPISAEALLGGLYDGLRLATIILCVGAANALANPKRLLKAVPAALYEVGSAIVVALSVFPQLAESLVRVRRARRLRGAHRGLRAIRAIAIPVLEDAMDRSLRLAAAMDSRGYGRSAALAAGTRRTTGALMVIGPLGVCVGVYGTLDASAPAYLGAPMLVGGIGCGAIALYLAGRRVRRSVYRADRWGWAETFVAACGLAAGLVYAVASGLHPTLQPLAVPEVPLSAFAGALVGFLPVVAAPPPPPLTTGVAT